METYYGQKVPGEYIMMWRHSVAIDTNGSVYITGKFSSPT